MIVPHPSQASSARAFTLLEVAIASAVLAVGLFAILTLCITNLRTARALGRVHVDASSVAALLSITNRLEEGVDSGDFGEVNPGYTWTRRITEFDFGNGAVSNGLFLVEIEVSGGSGPNPDRSSMQFLLYRPDSARRAGR
ncbi:MAG: prepilin-type N-terminal cleavage/methylation domain-containing protein [Verrucomicrobiota bacterium]|jgi:prepilin-type N-terminal cleavage/methylation domain-containing protein